MCIRDSSIETSYHIEGYKRDKYFFLATEEEGPWEPQFNYLTQTARMQYNYDPTEGPYKPTSVSYTHLSLISNF